ncbi:DnaD domain protein [Selenomonas flueggei]|uniref:DnaD domain protein n=1 Tax=Selenomonas flueggei TaxID=135080 RepID=UPI0026732AEF|nr:DnaD domain protein [Selenomonas flueggei]
MGLVEYRKGTAKGKASTYKLKIIPTTGVTTVGTTVASAGVTTGVTTVGTTVASAGVSGAYMTDQYRQEKTRQEKTIAAATRAREGDSALAEVVRVFEENIHPLSGAIERDNLIDLVDEYGGVWVTSAIGEAALSSGRNLRYITAILERWKRDGFKAPRKGVKQHGAGRNDSRAALEERYPDFIEADRDYIPPWKLRPPGGGDQAASG